MRAYSIVFIMMSIFLASLHSKAQDSISHEGKQYKVHKEPTKTYIVTSSDTIEIFIERNTNPLYPGGAKAMYEYISKNLQYPSTARKDKLQGMVVVSFIVDTQGRTDSVSVVKSVRSDLDQAAIQVIQNMPAWQPGTQDSKPFNARLTIPVNFKL